MKDRQYNDSDASGQIRDQEQQQQRESKAIGCSLRSQPHPELRWFASGPEGSFFTERHFDAEQLIHKAGFDRDEWTVTDLSAYPTTADPNPAAPAHDRGKPGHPPLTREDVASGDGPDSDRPFTDHVPEYRPPRDARDTIADLCDFTANLGGSTLVEDLRDQIHRQRMDYAATPIYPPGTWWQPIATAPKDGTVILGAYVWPSGNTDIYTCKFVDEWTDDMGSAVELPPTHWLPLPSPPTTE